MMLERTRSWLRCEESKEKHLREIKFEFTGRDTPQRNGKVERKIAGMTRRIKATLNSAKLDKKYRKVLWAECIMFLGDVENVLQSRRYDKPAYTAFFEKELEGLEVPTTVWRDWICEVLQ